jgi:hypothetical protein
MVLSAALLLAGTAHAQGGLSGSSLSPIVINATPIQPYGKIVRQCNCTVTSARNDGSFDPTAFESYDQAVQEGELALKDGQPGIAEIARHYREQKKTAPQAATLFAVQDNRGRLIVTSQKP